MDSEELQELEIKKNEDLNEEAEYAGNKQDLERMLLEAQRYLNIFHQIHIFSSKKKAEFEQSLIDMPERIRAVLLNLPGGRVLNEYIEDCEIKRGLREARTVYNNDPFLKNENEIPQSSAINKEFTQTIKEVMESYNTNLTQLNETLLLKDKQASKIEANANNQTKALIDALRENNKHQVEMLKTLGTTLSQAIMSARKEELQAIEAAIKKEKENTVVNTPVIPSATSISAGKDNTNVAVKTEIKKEESNKKEKTKDNNVRIDDVPVLHKFESPAPSAKKDDKDDDSGTEDIRQALSKTLEEKKPATQSLEVSDMDIASLLKDTTDNKDKESTKQAVDTQPKAPIALDSETLLKEAAKQNTQKQNTTDTTKDKPQSFGSAMQKIKNAITETASISLDKIKEAPISLNEIKDDLTDSFSKAFSSKKEEAVQPAGEEQWEYVDENGNPINPDEVNADEWEYVDENGNPINPDEVNADEWEYVDENGNPINPDEWEYVDENGNPIKK